MAEEYNELELLETPKGVYNSFPDNLARNELKGKVPAPDKPVAGYYLKIKAVNGDGTFTVEAVPAPSGGGELPETAKFETLAIGAEGAEGVYIQRDGTAEAPALVLYGEHGDEAVRLMNLARAVDDSDAPNLAQVREMVGNGSGESAACFPDWSHLKGYFLGDSLTAMETASKKYYDFIREKTGIQIIVDGIGGTGYHAGASTGTRFADRVKNIPDDVDIVVIFGSGNDVKNATVEEYKAGMAEAMAYFSTNRPGLPVIIMPPSPWATYNKRSEAWKTYCDTLELVALNYSLHYVGKMWTAPPFDPNFGAQQEAFFTDPEGVHPDERGHEALAPYFYNAMREVLAFEGKCQAGGGGNVGLDTTLTQSGAAADAKAVGDALAELEAKIPEGGGTGENATQTEHRLNGHTMGVIGDSLSDRSRQVTQWFDWIATRAGGMEFVLDCVSGRRLMQFPSNTMSAACDVICVFGGTNDFNSAQTLGTIDDTTSETFYGAVYKLATELRTNYPKALLVFITPMSSAPDYNSGENVKWHQFPQMGGHTVQDFADAIREVCGYLHIPVVDLFRDSGLNYNYDDPVSPYFVSDKLHLTSRGQEAISYVIEDAILRHYIPDNAQTGNVVSLVSIDAVFTQGDTIITTDSALSQLRDMLVVTGTYSDGSTKPVTAYSLSGTLTEGTSTITVNYSGKTDTFDVEVSRAGTSIEPYVVTLVPDAEMADGYYFIPDGGGTLNSGGRYSELVSIAGAQTIANDPDNVTYNWVKIYNLDKDQFAAGMIFYSNDMAIVGYGIIGLDSWGYYNQYPTTNISITVGFGWIATDADGKVTTEQNAVPMIPEGAVYMRVLLASSTTTGNTLLIS